MSSFSSGRFAVYKNTTDKKLKNPFSLKNSVHVEPLFNSETKRYTMNWFYNVLFENLYFYYTLIART